MSLAPLPQTGRPVRVRPPRWFALLVPVLAVLTLAGPLPTLRAQRQERIRAPELEGAVGYLGSDRPIRLRDLRGKIVVLEFWTFC